MKVFGYGRASTDIQVASTTQQHSVVLDAFEAYKKIKPAWANAVWAGFVADEATSRTSRFPQRHNGSLLVAACQPGDVIMVSNYDRIFANVVDVCETIGLFKERNIGLIILDFEIDTTTIIGEFCFKLLALVKELEVQEIRRRTREAVAHRNRVGLPGTYPRIGWMTKLMLIPGSRKPQKFLVPNNAVRRLAREILRIKINNNFSYNEAMDYCNENKILRNRKKWTKRTFLKWCDAAREDFVLPNGNHEAAPIPANAVPCAITELSDD